MEKFKEGVSEKLDHYVYFLIDPRNGHTFYVGKGQGDRIFAHVTGALKAGDGETAERIRLIQDILRDGLEPIHVIHRHGMKGCVAEEVEAALIDVMPGLTNKVRGGGSERGPARVEQLNERYTHEIEGFNLYEPRDPNRPTIVIKITNKGLAPVDGDTYEAVRASWRMSEERLARINAVPHLVLAVHDTHCVNAYEVEAGAWERDGKSRDDAPRYMFTGKQSNETVRRRYMRKRFLNRKGETDRGQYPIRFFNF